MPKFYHESLDVYQAAVEFVVEANNIYEALPRGRSHLADQLLRVAIAIPLNIAAGSSEMNHRDRARYYRIALRSATECVAILDVCQRMKLINEPAGDSGRELLHIIVHMLTQSVHQLLHVSASNKTAKVE